MDSRKIYRMLVASPFLLLLLLIVYCFYTGRGQHRKPTHEELDQALLRYMQSKYAIYEDTFTIDQPGDVEWASGDLFYSSTGIYKLELKSKKYPTNRDEEKIVLRYNFEEDTLRDTYMSFVFREEVENKFRELFDRVFQEGTYELFIVMPNAPWPQNDFKSTITVDEYVTEIIENEIRICVMRNSELIERDMAVLLDELKEKDLGIDARIYYTTERQFANRNIKGKWLDVDRFEYENRVWILRGKGDDDYALNSIVHSW